MKRTKLPIGIQNFRDFHRDGFIYVDKTEYIHRLVWQGKYYFLSRPRRFGKSLLVSTLKELFSGSQELFEGLWIYDKWDWTKTSPVIHLSFTCLNYQDRGLDVAISSELDEIAASYQIDLPTDMPYKDKFKALLKQVSAKHGEIVLLIDEYDKPIIDYLEYEKLPQAKENQGIMKNFYSVLKDSGAYLRFVFITGVSKFSKVSIFSDLNHLDDLTLHPDYALLTGYTQADLEFYFADYLTSATERLKMNRVDVIQRVREWYNGFSWDGINTVYNPFGTLLFLAQHDFRNYWSETGTPTFLFEQMKKQENFEYENVVTSSDLLNKYDLNNLEMVALLFQTGYLTVKKRDFINGEIVLDYPNREVRSSLYGFLIDNLTPNQSTPPAVVAVQDLNRAFLKDDLDKVKNIIGTLFSDLPYDLYERNADKKKEMEVSERFFHSIIHLVFKYLGIYINSEVHSSGGRADSVVETPTHIYIFEFKYNRSGKAAMVQLKKNNYADKYRISNKIISGIGVNFSHITRKINGWVIEVL